MTLTEELKTMLESLIQKYNVEEVQEEVRHWHFKTLNEQLAIRRSIRNQKQ